MLISRQEGLKDDKAALFNDRTGQLQIIATCLHSHHASTGKMPHSLFRIGDSRR